MKEFTDALAAVRNQCANLGEKIAKRHKRSVQDPPIEAFSMAFNHVTLALELTSFYEVAFIRQSPKGLKAEQIAKKREENGQRLVMLSKTAFSWTLSGIEYAAKRAIEKYPSVLPTKRAAKSLYLGEIVGLSVDVGLIAEAKRPLWFGVNTIRNKVVHNNGFGDGEATWEFSSELTVVMENGKMIQGTIMTFPRLLSWTVGEYADWCDQFLSKTNPPS